MAITGEIKSVEPQNKSSFKGIIFVFVILVILAFGYFILIQFPAFSFLSFAKEKFPTLENPKEVTFNWEYKNQKYTLEETYYQSVDEYYGKKEKGIFEGQEEKSVNDYLAINEKDTSCGRRSGLGESASNANCRLAI